MATIRDMLPLPLEDFAVIFRRHPTVQRVRLFGSRALGTARYNSDIDLAIDGDVAVLEAERIRSELDEELPIPHQFDDEGHAEVPVIACVLLMSLRPSESRLVAC